jgi:hypothetical protein
MKIQNMVKNSVFAYSTTENPTYAFKTGNLLVGQADISYSSDGNITWWSGPDEDLGYVVATSTTGGQTTPTGEIANVTFWATTEKTDSDFINLVNSISNESFTGITDCVDWIYNNGYWTSYISTEISANTITNNSFIVKWEPITNNNTYEIQVSTDANFSTIVQSATTQVLTYKEFTGLTNNTDYYVRIRGLGFQIDSNYQQILNYASENSYQLPSESVQKLQSNLITELKFYGIWDSEDVIWVFANGMSGSSGNNFSLLNWKNPGTFTATIYNDVTLHKSKGFIGNGTGSYIDTNFSTSLNGVNYTLNNASRHMLVTDNPNNNYFSRIDGTNNLPFANATRLGSTTFININSGENRTSFPFFIPTYPTFIGVNLKTTEVLKQNGIIGHVWNNGQPVNLNQNIFVNPTSLSSGTQTIFNTGTNPSLYSFGYYSMGAGLTLNEKNYNSIIKNYYNQLLQII